MDASATSSPKDKRVVDAMTSYLLSVSCNINRGDYDEAYDVSEKILSLRETLCKLFNFKSPERVILTHGVTESLNCVIKGLFDNNDHVIVSSMEHNSVMRPLNQNGISFSRFKHFKTGEADLSSIEPLIKKNTKAIIVNHCSNVSGTLMPIAEIGEIAHRHGLIVIADAAQSAGHVEIDMEKMGIDILCFTGHKGLGGPEGTGGFLLSEGIQPEPLVVGGTGSFSDEETVPKTMPDMYEAGTQDIPGLLGLEAALRILKVDPLTEIRDYFLDGLKKIEGIRLYGKSDLPIFAVGFERIDNAAAGMRLYRDYGIMTRVGMHCSPSAHKTLGTFPSGVVRFSPDRKATKEDLDYALSAIREVAKG